MINKAVFVMLLLKRSKESLRDFKSTGNTQHHMLQHVKISGNKVICQCCDGISTIKSGWIFFCHILLLQVGSIH